MMESFLSQEHYHHLFLKTVSHPTQANKERLNYAFKDFYNEIRFKKYISTALWRHARDYLSKEKTERRYYLLKMDQPVGGQEGDASQQTSYGEQNAAEHDQEVSQTSHLLDHIENPELYGALKHLTARQLRMLELYILHYLTHDEIAALLGVSQQAVSKTIKQSLAKIRERLEEGEEGEERDGSMGRFNR